MITETSGSIVAMNCEVSFRTDAYYDQMFLPPGQQILFPGLEEPDVMKNWGNQ